MNSAGPPSEKLPYIPMHELDNLLQARAALIPYPRKVDWGEGVYHGEQISETLGPLSFSESVEAYALTIDEHGIRIKANMPAGLIYARATLRQLGAERPQHYPFVSIEDFPAYAVRGVMHDVGRNFQTIDLTDLYANNMNPFNAINRVYFKQIAGTAKGDPDFALGGIIATWNDVNVERQQQVLRNNPFYLTALTGAEVMWNGNPSGSLRYTTLIPPTGTLEHSMLEEFEQRLMKHKNRYFNDDELFYRPQLNTAWEIVAADGTTRQALGNTVILKRRGTDEGLYPELPVGSVIKARTTIVSDASREARLYVGFGVPARSHRMWQGIPDAGQWDAFGAVVRLNGEELPPPSWQEPGKFRQLKPTWHQPIQEEPWREEELYWLRQPVVVRLKQGDNTIELSSRYGYADQQWQFSLWLD